MTTPSQRKAKFSIKRHAPSSTKVCVRPLLLFHVEQIRPRTSQVYNFRAAISILFQTCTFEAVKSVRDTLSIVSDHRECKRTVTYLTATNNTLVLVISERALVADAHECCRAHIGIADWTLSIALIAESTDGNASLLAAHNEIAATRLALRAETL